MDKRTQHGSKVHCNQCIDEFSPNSPELSLIGERRLFRVMGHSNCDQSNCAVDQTHIKSATQWHCSVLHSTIYIFYLLILIVLDF